jgi:hypothetical protein
MPSENPKILDLPPNQWTKVATNIFNGFGHILQPDTVYYKTYRLNGNPPPDNLPVPGDPDFEGVGIYNRPDEIAGQEVFVGGAKIKAGTGIDFYIYAAENSGKMRIDRGQEDEKSAVPDVFLWYDGADARIVELNGSRVAEWRDKSGNDFTLTETNPARQALYLFGGQNGRNVLRFSRTRGDHLRHSLFTLPVNQPQTVFIVAKEIIGSGFRTLMQGTSDVWRIGSFNNKIQMLTGGSPTPVGATAFGAQTRLHTFIFNGASSQLFLDREVNPLVGNSLSTALKSGLELGSRLATGASHAWNGDIDEIKLYKRILSVPELEATWDQMIPKWGILET